MRLSGYSPEIERKVERLLSELYDTLEIQKPDDLYGSIVIETRYQNGRPIGQVDINIRYVMKRSDSRRPKFDESSTQENYRQLDMKR